jgi:hypothetical protein
MLFLVWSVLTGLCRLPDVIIVWHVDIYLFLYSKSSYSSESSLICSLCLGLVRL